MMAGLNEGRSYRRQLFDEIFDFSEDDSLFAEDVEEDELAGDQDMNEGGIGAVANTDAIKEGPLTGTLFPYISTMFNFYKEHARLKGLNMDMKRRLEANDIAGIRHAKSISQAAYEEFNDVISFDTTYLINRYKLPFATIVGVNHHGQSILLGCALISHEDANTFEWLFMMWLEAMGDIHPNSILTDQSVIYDSLTIKMFERNLNEFVVKHGLERNEWLSKLYVDREYWVPIYLNHTFWAGMVSTQRSESMHAHCDGYVNSMSTLKQFVEQYEIAMCDKIEKEFYADFKSKNTVVNCISVFKWEEQFQKAFTNSIFQLVQEEIKRMWYCHVIQPTDEGRHEADNEPGIKRHKIMEKSIINNWYRREFVYDVEYRENGQYFSCNCKKFESKGILCCHIMRLMSLKDIKFINE
ncbi:hypothetical protein GH714_007295 [Hevea brasiliensis]|uniref:Protein FAR1-RELATED SEQUENCE n=1 Tax=Hevea brasiliensis TaxID=3981 RepID=A0A6A6MXP2_HEVBR|nr:hypothetical protein GH714_007295 [Hevea brasiliensis]